MFTKFLIKIGSNFFYRSHDTILIRLSMEIESQPILKRFFYSTFVLTDQDFCRKHIARKYRMENRIV